MALALVDYFSLEQLCYTFKKYNRYHDAFGLLEQVGTKWKSEILCIIFNIKAVKILLKFSFMIVDSQCYEWFKQLIKSSIRYVFSKVLRRLGLVLGNVSLGTS